LAVAVQVAVLDEFELGVTGEAWADIVAAAGAAGLGKVVSQ
jgi:hypothetical protein